MKSLIVLAVLFGSASAFAKVISEGQQTVCGVLGADVTEGSLELNLADSVSYAGKVQNYDVLNPYGFEWQAGSCVCLTGEVLRDPDPDMALYKGIQVKKIEGNPQSCDASAPTPDGFTTDLNK